MKINEYGRSMTEMLGVLAIIGVLSAGGLAGYGKAMYTYNMQKTVSFVSDAIFNYELFTKQNFGPDKDLKKDNMAQKIRDYGLLPECNPEPASLNTHTYQVCHAPLGEISPRLSFQKTDDGMQYIYELHVTFLKNHLQACSDFLVRGWDRTVPAKLWKRGTIQVASDSKDQLVYNLTTNKLDVSSASNACESVCGEAPYCSVVFTFKGIKY